MRTIIALGGRPGSGKTTIMRAILARNQSNMTNPIPGLACHHIVALNTKILGNYSDDHLFGGADRLSMSIQMWQARSERLDARLVDSKSIRTDYYNVFLNTGVLLRSDWICAQ
jgi:predicted ATPase